MHTAPVPINEAERLRTLISLRVLDTLPEAFSDAVSTAAAAIANVPISAISLVDVERQWFKGSCGLDARETSRDVSFCAYAILSDEPFLVTDALADPRFRHNPLVTGAPHIRAYAGFPIVVDGAPVGSLCVIDDRPREFSVEQIDRLTTLAAGTAAWLIERQSLASTLDRTEAELRYVTLTDPVTGLPNRLMFQDRLKQAVLRCGRSKASLAVLFIDIDGFKRLIDGWGEDAANAVLSEVGRRITTLCRSSDTVARLGNDQFLLLTEWSDLDRLHVLASAIALELAKPFDPPGIGLTASIGLACQPSDGPADRLVANADTAMLNAKREGGNCCRFFTASMDEAAHTRASLLGALRTAVHDNALQLHYQPKIYASTSRIEGVEALLRWQHPQRGTIGPVVFIPLAESAGLINELGAWVIEEACRQMADWRSRGRTLRVAINLSVFQLRQPDLADHISFHLKRFDLDPGMLTCEITESIAMDDAGPALDVFQRLKATGIQLSIDDFGTGYSSLSYLRKLPVHQLKIDRSFVTDLADSDDARSIAAAIINLAHALRLEVVAEGVETVRQHEILLELGCDKLQGFFFARPMTADAMEAWTTDVDDQARTLPAAE